MATGKLSEDHGIVGAVDAKSDFTVQERYAILLRNTDILAYCSKVSKCRLEHDCRTLATGMQYNELTGLISFINTPLIPHEGQRSFPYGSTVLSFMKDIKVR